jgi:hypothetical protein
MDAHTPLGRVLFIVSRNEPKLHAYLKAQFTDLPSVDVVLDRRQNELAPSVRPDERDRRRHAVDADVRRFGWAVVKRGNPAARSS